MENNNKTLVFKTNINCDGCIATVKPFLDKAEGICHWEVNTTDNNKMLTVHSKGISEAEVIATVQKAGYTIEAVNA